MTKKKKAAFPKQKTQNKSATAANENTKSDGRSPKIVCCFPKLFTRFRADTTAKVFSKNERNPQSVRLRKQVERSNIHCARFAMSKSKRVPGLRRNPRMKYSNGVGGTNSYIGIANKLQVIDCSLGLIA